MAPTLKRRVYAVGHPLGPTIGDDVRIFKHGLRHYESNFFADPPYDRYYGEIMRRAVRELQRREGFTQRDYVNQETFEVIWKNLDAYRRLQYRRFQPPAPPIEVPDLGPVFMGEESILFWRLTHNTDGIPHYPAKDGGWRAGRSVIAPETIVVTDQSGSQGGDAFYASGASTIEYWFGHLVRAPATGTKILKGLPVGTIANIPWSDGGPHLHLGINAAPLIGHDLMHTDYGHQEAATVGRQLAIALAPAP